MDHHIYIAPVICLSSTLYYPVGSKQHKVNNRMVQYPLLIYEHMQHRNEVKKRLQCKRKKKVIFCVYQET